VSNLALLGLTDEQIARELGIGTTTLERWQAKHPEFRGALKSGKLEADAKVARGLYERACGYSHPAAKVFLPKGATKAEDAIVVPYTEHYPPDTAAAFIWLKNRQKQTWRDRHEIAVTDQYIDLPEEQRLEWAERIIERARRLLGAPTIEHEPDDGGERDPE
jgi:transcriptional regulator with XRE-family HTH domain